MPLASIVMANYNHSTFLHESIDSIINQTFRDFEFIIVDDLSTDNSVEIIKKFAKQDDRIKLLLSGQKPYLSLGRPLNLGIKKATGKYIFRFDSDDVSDLDRLKKQIDFMEDYNNRYVGVCGTNFELIDANSRSIGFRTFPEESTDIKNSLQYRNPFGHSSVVIKKECFEKYGLFDETINTSTSEELDLWFRLKNYYEFHNLQVPLVKYRIGDNNISWQKQKVMINATIYIRKKAVTEYGFKFNTLGNIYNQIIKIMIVLPAGLVNKLFILSLLVKGDYKRI